MAGGLLNLIAVGSQNVILTGNPKKTFFKFTYTKYSNFGLQKFRLDYEGSKVINTSDKTKFKFKVPRYGDMLMDTFLVLRLPHIWSPIYWNEQTQDYVPYEFKWIENLGTQIIEELEVYVGGEILQRVNGQYLTALVQRDFTNTQNDLYNKMTGNTAEFNDPANFGQNGGNYPNAQFSGTQGGAQPSIVGRDLYIPLNVWFTLASKLAFPLVALQYNELHIEVTLRPVQEWFTIREVNETEDALTGPCTYSHIQPNFNVAAQQFYTFLQSPPPNVDPDSGDPIPLVYTEKRTDWNADVHLISTYGFLSDDERRVFASQPQNYLIKEVYEYKFHNVVESQKIELNSLGLVAEWMFFFRRSDANLRNEWSNYTNWPYNYPPMQLSAPPAPIPGTLSITGPYNVCYKKDILLDLGILLDGKYRENVLAGGIYNYVEKYLRTTGNAPDGLYVYNFAINGSILDFQPSGAINLSRFNTIEYEFTTITPPRDTQAQTFQICDPTTNELVGVNKNNWQIYEYTYDLYIYEERYNMVKFESGNAGLMYAR